jgi:hypothetical protein
MTAGIVDICGAFGGITAGPNRNNKKGMFENERVRNGLIKPYLRSMGFDPMGQFPLPQDMNSLKAYPELGFEMELIMKQDGYRNGPWYYKGAKMCLVWPVFHKAFPNAKWIIVRRPIEEIVFSCLKTPFMRKLKTAEAWREWVHTHIRRFREMREAGLDISVVWTPDIVRGEFSQIKSIIEQLGLKWNEKAVSEFVDPKLWNGGDNGC